MNIKNKIVARISIGLRKADLAVFQEAIRIRFKAQSLTEVHRLERAHFATRALLALCVAVVEAGDAPLDLSVKFKRDAQDDKSAEELLRELNTHERIEVAETLEKLLGKLGTFRKLPRLDFN